MPHLAFSNRKCVPACLSVNLSESASAPASSRLKCHPRKSHLWHKTASAVAATAALAHHYRHSITRSDCCVNFAMWSSAHATTASCSPTKPSSQRIPSLRRFSPLLPPPRSAVTVGNRQCWQSTTSTSTLMSSEGELKGHTTAESWDNRSKRRSLCCGQRRKVIM